MTSALEQEAAEQGAVEIMGTVMRWHMPDDLPYCYVEFDSNIDLKWAMQRYSNIVAAYRKARSANELERPAPQQPQARPQTRQNAPQRQQGGGRSPFPSRADKMPEIEGWACDQCNGPVGLFETQNGGRLAKCLGTCKDPGGRNGYVHTVKDEDGELAFVPDDAALVQPF